MKNKLRLFSLLLVLAVSLSACSKNEPEPASEPEDGNDTAYVDPSDLTPDEAAAHNAGIDQDEVELIQITGGHATETVVIQTSKGDIEIELYGNEAPLAVENFVTHARNGYYNGMNFYKVIENFILQSGAPDSKAAESIYTDDDGNPVTFDDEFSLKLWNFRGSLVMLGKGVERPNTNTSEFFIVHAGPVYDEELIAEMKALNYPKKVLETYQEVGGIPGFDWRYTVFGMVVNGMDVVDEIAEMEVDQFGEPTEIVLIESITVK